jgi:hypothetical protein
MTSTPSSPTQPPGSVSTIAIALLKNGQANSPTAQHTRAWLYDGQLYLGPHRSLIGTLRYFHPNNDTDLPPGPYLIYINIHSMYPTIHLFSLYHPDN